MIGEEKDDDTRCVKLNKAFGDAHMNVLNIILEMIASEVSCLKCSTRQPKLNETD